MVIPSVKTEEAMKMFDNKVEIIQVPSKKEYLRMTPDPSKK